MGRLVSDQPRDAAARGSAADRDLRAGTRRQGSRKPAGAGLAAALAVALSACTTAASAPVSPAAGPVRPVPAASAPASAFPSAGTASAAAAAPGTSLPTAMTVHATNTAPASADAAEDESGIKSPAASTSAPPATATSAPPVPSPPPASRPVTRNPALRPLDSRALQKTVKSLAAELVVPGAVVVLKTPNGNFSFAHGTRTYHGSEPVSMADHIRIGSITKTWTGTVILQQVQEGKLKLDDPVSKYRPGIPNGRNITIAQLLDMRSGLYSYNETPELNELLDRTPSKAWAPGELLALALHQEPYFAPGNGFYYSNTNAILLGLVAEKLDRKPLARIFRDRIFAPLGMNDTVFPFPGVSGLPAPHPQGYMYGNNTETLYTKGLPGFVQQEARHGSLKPGDVTDMNPSWVWAAGAGISTAQDLSIWAETLADGKLLNARLQRARLASTESPEAGSVDGGRYGLALAKFGRFYGHAGIVPGFSTFAAHDPANHVTLVVWTNLAPAPDGRSPATAIARAIAAQVYAGTGGMEPAQ